MEFKNRYEPTHLPKWNQPGFGSQRDQLEFIVEKPVTSKIREILEKRNISVHPFLISVWATLLWRYHQTDDVLFLVKMKDKTWIPIRLSLHPNTLFSDLVQHLENHLLVKSQDSFEGIEEEDFDHFLQVSSFAKPTENPLKNDFDPEGFPFGIHAEWGDQLTITISYLTQFFLSSWVESSFIHLQNIMNSITNNFDILLKDIDVLSPTERHRYIYEFNQTDNKVTHEKTIDQLIVEQMKNHPNKVAIVSEQGDLTYQELDEKSNQLARYLIKNGVKHQQIVGLLMKQSPLMIIGMLGIIKAGATYLPIDPAYPLKRINYLLVDSQVSILLSESSIESIEGFQGKTLHLDQECYQYESSVAPNSRCELHDPVYVIYTSGSTGFPKGVVVEHRALLNLVTWHNQHYQITSNDTSTKYAGLGFDASVWEIFPYLAAGATIHIIPESIRMDVQELHRYYERNHITCSFLPTPVAEQFMKQDNRSLRLLLTGGDQLRHVQKQSYQIANNYGPTENTVVTTSGFVSEDRPITIGKPIANNQVYILNRRNQLQPVGVPGELCISGANLARGYLNNSQLTKEKFVEHPLFPGKRLYRTGDLARWLPDGQIECLGRIDQQVTIRGFRIELGEIEATLMRHPKVKEAVVIADSQQQEELSLCAYVVEDIQPCSIEELKAYLATILPNYMIPDFWVKMDHMPLTENGKIDKKALPRDFDSSSTCRLIDQDLTAIEKKLMWLWSEVLGKPPRRRNDHFFQLGGHSIKAMVLIARIRNEFGITITWADFFENQTFEKMTHLIQTAEPYKNEPIQPAKTQKDYPVSSVQRQLFALQQTRDCHTTYHIPIVWAIKGKLDYTRLQQTIQRLIDRHEVLRTSFEYINGELRQKIHDHVEWKMIQLSAVNEADARKKITAFIQPFNLFESPLFRVALIRLSTDEHILVFDIHHLICDGVSTAIFHREFAQVYQGTSLPDVRYQYKDYSFWLQKQLHTNQFKDAEHYWLSQFSEGVPNVELTTDFCRPRQQQFNGKRIRFTFDQSLTLQCLQFSENHQVTIYMTLLSVYYLLLSKMTGETSLVVGSAVAGRSQAEWESVFGMFVNTLPIVAHPKKDHTFNQFLNQVKKQVLQAQEHSDYPFAELVEKIGIDWDQSRNPFFDTVFVMQNVDIPAVQIPGLTVEKFAIDENHAMFDMTWEIEQTDQIHLTVEYNTDLFRHQTVTRMFNHYMHLLKQVMADPTRNLSEFVLITPEEKEQILSGFNPTPENDASFSSVLQLFAQQVQQRPDHIAVVSGNQAITYQALNAESNKLARRLQQNGIEKEEIISVVADASIEFFISLYAILKAGGAFLPIDPALPLKRIEYMIDNSCSSLILYQKGIQIPNKYDRRMIQLERQAWANEWADDLKTNVSENQLAYVIYTSGSTGRPKGVMIEHGSLLNLVQWHQHFFRIHSRDRSTKFAGVSFDASIWEIFPYLSAGATVYIVDPSIRHDLQQLNHFIEKNNITICFLPTAIAEQFIELENDTLRLLLVGGDRLNRVRPQTYSIVNNYGPTENTVVTTCYPIRSYDQPVVPIGRPIRNQQVYILNEELQLQPIGVPGELCISGKGLARGYLHEPELTNHQFCPNPFDQDKRIYRTGDLARWLPDGNIEYLGRLDHQVQIRGHRIECGEVEHMLSTHPKVKETVVMVQEDSLCAYFVGRERELEGELREFLKHQLPQYMIPTHWIQMDHFPLTVNGKIDRKSLPKPKRASRNQSHYVSPTNPTQQLLVEIWQEILDCDRIGIQDNFFSLGGDSIKAIQVAARLQQHQRKLAVHHLLQYPTIAELSRFVKDLDVQADQQPVSGDVPLTPIQRWFFSQTFSDKHHWNQAVMISNQNAWDIQLVRKAFEQLVRHHDGLRMSYSKEKDGSIKQINSGIPGTFFTVEEFCFKGHTNRVEKIEAEANRLQRSLNLFEGPLIRVAIFETDEKHELLMIIHHLLIDGVSWRILLEDFYRLYQGFDKNEEVSLPMKTTSFQTWAKELQAYANTPELLKEVSYWREMEETSVPSIFKSEKTFIKGGFKDCETIDLTLSIEQTNHLLNHVHQAYRTEMNDLLLAGLCLAIQEWAQVDRVAIHLEGHGREPISDQLDLTRTVGWFTSVYPIVFDLASPSLPLLIKSVKEKMRSIPKKGIGYGILQYLTSKENRMPLQFQLQPEISFNYLGQFSEAIRFAGMGAHSARLGEPFSPSSPVHHLEIYGIVIDEQLHFQFLYQQAICERVKMQRLVDLYQHFLGKIIEHCIAKKETTITPSDLSASDLSMEELDQFLESLD